MIDSDVQRLSSNELEDLAFVILSAQPDGSGFDVYPEIAESVRVRLRSRIRQLAKYDWPSSMAEDPQFRRGWTLRQCCRLAVTLLMLDAHLPPSLIVQLARNNEIGLLFVIAERLADPTRTHASPNDHIAIIVTGELTDTLDITSWSTLQAGRIRLLARRDLALAWDGDLSGPGARHLIDISTAIAAAWRWIAERRLMG